MAVKAILRFPVAAHAGRGVVAALMLAAVPVAGQAQETRPAPEKPLNRQLEKPPEPPSKLPTIKADRTRGLDFLFGALKAAPDEASAKHVEARIWAQWIATPSDTAQLLMTRAKVAVDAKQFDVALELLDAIVKLRPDYTEAWNRRATVYYLKDDYDHALHDLEQVLAREPRHFGALAGLGMIMRDLGDDKRALDAFRKALAINPHLDKIPDLVKTLTEKVEGRDI
jgi:tetratricopeptide (TPR) repeat protein